MRRTLRIRSAGSGGATASGRRRSGFGARREEAETSGLPRSREPRRGRAAARTSVVGRDLFGLGFVGGHDAVAQDVGRQLLDVLGDHVAAAAHQGQRLGGAGQVERGARRGAERDQVGEIAEAGGPRVARGRHQVEDVACGSWRRGRRRRRPRAASTRRSMSSVARASLGRARPACGRGSRSSSARVG